VGWNKQSGESWVLMRSLAHVDNEQTQFKALALRVTGLLTIADAELLAHALAREVTAAKLAERKPPFQYTVIYQCRKCGAPIHTGQAAFGSPETGWEHMEGECPWPLKDFVAETLEAKEQMFGDAVLKNWDEVLGEEPKPSYLGKMSEPVDEEEGCSDCE
jgi:hypothetical protein